MDHQSIIDQINLWLFHMSMFTLGALGVQSLMDTRKRRRSYFSREMQEIINDLDRKPNNAMTVMFCFRRN